MAESLTTGEIAATVSGRLVGPGDLVISGVEQLDIATPEQLSFIRDAKNAHRWAPSKAGAALVTEGVEVEPGQGRAVIFVKSADLAMAIMLEAFAPDVPRPAAGIHPSAVIDQTAEIGEGVAVGPGCTVGPRVKIGAGTQLHANVHIFADAQVGAGCLFWPGVVIRERCIVGNICVFHSNVVIGADGFGYRPSSDGRGITKIPQIGHVEIGHDVEIGANSCVDRGKFSATRIGDQSKIDNLVQVGHNVTIGRCVVVAAGCGLAGGVRIDDGAMVGGMVGVIDAKQIGAGAKVGGFSCVRKDVKPGEAVVGDPAQPISARLREVALLRRLPDLVKSLRAGSK